MVSISLARPPAADGELPEGAAPLLHRISFPAALGADYAIERSIDLENWTHRATVTSYTGEVIFFDDAFSLEGRQFYRARELAPNP